MYTNSKNWRTYSELRQISRDIILDDKTLQYFDVPKAYQSQHSNMTQIHTS